MSSQPRVTSRHVLDALTQCRHRRDTAMQRLEAAEPDLADYVMEALSFIHQQLAQLGGSVRDQRRVFRLIEELALVSIDAARRSQRSDTDDQPDSSPNDAADV